MKVKNEFEGGSMKPLKNGSIMSKLFVIVMTVLMMPPCTFSLEAGIWDSLKSKFVKAEAPQPPTIKVLVLHDADAAVVEVKGKYNLFDPHQNKKIGSYFVGKSNLIQPLAAGLKWGEEFPDHFQIKITPDNPSITVVVDGIEYKGSIYVYDIGGSISIVNEVDLEDYLSSVLGLTIDQKASEEALAALAIASRTEAYFRATSSQNPYWNVDAQQVKYQGNAVTARSRAVEQAIVATKYMVMSKTGAYEKTLTPFHVEIVEGAAAKKNTFSLEHADALAQKGDNAAKILSKIFPNTSIELAHSVEKGWEPIAGNEPTK